MELYLSGASGEGLQRLTFNGGGDTRLWTISARPLARNSYTKRRRPLRNPLTTKPGKGQHPEGSSLMQPGTDLPNTILLSWRALWA
jgi:hypothetical protein